MEEKNEFNKEFILFKSVSIIDKYNFYEYLSVMLDGGVSISESLESVNSKITSPYFREKIKELNTYISSGDSFSKSMKKIPSIFPASEISVIESGETTGQLTQSLMNLSEDLKKIHELKTKIKGALTYPIIIFLFLFLALIIVLTYVIPAIKPLFEDSNIDLPLSTQLLLSTSGFFVSNIWLIILLFASLFVFFIGFKNTKSGRQSIELFLLNFPLIGRIYRNYILANIASTLGSLIGSGVSMVKTLTLVGKSTNNSVYNDIFEELVMKVSKGEAIVKSMEDLDPYKKYFPADYLQMLSVGERTANIESIAKKINRQYEKEVDYSIASMTKWIEPIAILFAGGFILWFAFAIFGAILKVTQVVG